MNQVIENILTRRSVRRFTEEKISRQDLELILKCAAYAPSGMNKQTWQFTAVTDRKKLDELAKVIGEELGRDGYNFYNADVLIIPSNIRDGYWSKEDNACALENIFLAAHSLGIGSVWINQLQQISDKPEVRRLLAEWGIPEEHVVHGMAALGYAAAPPSQDVDKKGVIKIID